MDWSEPYLKLEQSHKSLKDALNQERYEDAANLLYEMVYSTEKLATILFNISLKNETRKP